MQKLLSKLLFYFGVATTCLMMIFTTGCVSGGFTLTRTYAKFINSKQIVLRIVLYILTGIVFAITLLVDMIVNNTIDFWEGRVSAGSYKFHKGENTYIAQHEFMPNTNLKRSTIKVMDSNDKLLQVVIFRETPTHEIELLVDGKIRAKAENMSSLPKLSSFDEKGKLIEQQDLWLSLPIEPTLVSGNVKSTSPGDYSRTTL